MLDIIKYNKLVDNDIEIVENYNMDEMNEIINSINLDNYTTYIVNPLE